jgi:hypothetical protein
MLLQEAETRIRFDVCSKGEHAEEAPRWQNSTKIIRGLPHFE